jgi:hypothetical protein
MLLSELNKGDFFKFIDGQTALHLTNNNNAAEYNTMSHVEFEVLKKNEMSVKVKPTDGRVEYVFKFKGCFNNYTKQGVDCEVEKVFSNVNEI